MLATAFSSETVKRLSVSVNHVKQKLPILEKAEALGRRLMEAFGTDDKAFIAEKLGFSSVQSVYKVINGSRELDFEKLQNFRNYTKCSIDWLLTGEGDGPIKMKNELPFAELVEERLRAIVREEMQLERHVNLKGGLQTTEQIRVNNIKLSDEGHKKIKKAS